jgi:RND superfamily putative drug exporter
MFGVGMALAVIVDATLVRGALVPAFMRLAGNANWWAPRPLRRLYERFGISEAEPSPTLTVALPEPERVAVEGR